MHVSTGDGFGASSSPEVEQAAQADLTESEQKAALGKMWWRLLPLLFVCYVIAYVDRINVGFAKLHFREVLGVEPGIFDKVFGLGAGLFFIGYFIFEIPSNLVLQRVGARIWIARILIVWGFVSMSFMWMKGVTMFYVMRFLLGAAEAGFFPGVLLYFTYWYPSRERAKIIALFAVGGVAAGIVGSPVSGAILEHMDKVAGMAGWKWLFLLEAIPAILLGVVVWFALPNGPKNARWLNEREKAWALARVEEDHARADADGDGEHRLAGVFTSPRVWFLCAAYFMMNVGAYGYEMWAPTIVKKLSGQGDSMVGLIGAIPYLAAGLVMMAIGQHSDRTGERRWHVAWSAATAAIGFMVAANTQNAYVAMAGITLAFAALKSTLGPFWALTTGFLRGTAAAGGIALINSVGNLGGFFGPKFVGDIKSATGSDFWALVLLGGALFGMAVFVLMVPRPKSSGDATA